MIHVRNLTNITAIILPCGRQLRRGTRPNRRLSQAQRRAAKAHHAFSPAFSRLTPAARPSPGTTSSGTASGRRNIGYMPESCPLYTEMRVRDISIFVPASKECRAGSRINASTTSWNAAGWTVQTQIIGTLSKGYRQPRRPADAAANPPVLISTMTGPRSQADSLDAADQELGQEHDSAFDAHSQRSRRLAAMSSLSIEALSPRLARWKTSNRVPIPRRTTNLSSLAWAIRMCSVCRRRCGSRVQRNVAGRYRELHHRQNTLDLGPALLIRH